MHPVQRTCHLVISAHPRSWRQQHSCEAHALVGDLVEEGWSCWRILDSFAASLVLHRCRQVWTSLRERPLSFVSGGVVGALMAVAGMLALSHSSASPAIDARSFPSVYVPVIRPQAIMLVPTMCSKGGTFTVSGSKPTIRVYGLGAPRAVCLVARARAVAAAEHAAVKAEAAALKAEAAADEQRARALLPPSSS